MYKTALGGRRPLNALLRGLALAVSVGLTAACQVAPPANGWSEITFQHRPKLVFDAAEIAIEESYEAPIDPPHVAHLFPVPPGEAAARWARDRLAAGGPSGRLVYKIREASAVETELETESGIQGLFTSEQSERYLARLVVEVRLLDDRGMTRAAVEAEVERSVTVPEDATLREREEAWFRLTEALMQDYDAELEGALYQYMAAHILN
jgi:hypothetical protein